MLVPVLICVLLSQVMSRIFASHWECFRSEFRILRRYYTAPKFELLWWRGYLQPFIKAIPFPKVTELPCRLPSLTLFYRSEAAYLGDLMRMWVRTNEKWKACRIFMDYRRFAISLECRQSLSHQFTSLHKSDSRNYRCQQKQTSFPRDFRSLLQVTLCHHSIHIPAVEYYTRYLSQEIHQRIAIVSPLFRTVQPMCNRCSHEILLPLRSSKFPDE